MIIVGENDVGKTVVMDAIEMLVSDIKPDVRDFRRGLDGKSCDSMEIRGVFEIESKDSIETTYRSGPSKNLLDITKIITHVDRKTIVLGMGFDDDRLNDLNSISADDQKAALREAGLTPASNKIERLEQLAQAEADGLIKRREKIMPVKFADIRKYLPVIERTNSVDYEDPASLIRSTLRNVARRVVEPRDDEGRIVENPALKKVKSDIEAALNIEVSKAKSELQKIHSGLVDISIEPHVDFGSSLAGIDIKLDFGDGLQSASQYGQGTNRRMWMGLQEWQRNVAKESGYTSVIALFDEPDTNLHIRAQQDLLEHLSNRAGDHESRTQVFICTHSAHLIDRAPAQAIRILEAQEDGTRVSKKMQALDDRSVRDFMNDLGRSIGLTNSALLYEKAFLIVEGDSEEEALPIIYKKIYNRTMVEDGITIVNLETCSAWKSALELMFKNRLDYVHFLLDRDCAIPGSSARINNDTLLDLAKRGMSVDGKMTFVGSKEFEDSFPDDVILQCLESEYPRQDGNKWNKSDIHSVRSSPKFSDSLKNLVVKNVSYSLRTSVGKVSIAVALAKTCDVSDVPDEVKEALVKVRMRAGLGPAI